MSKKERRIRARHDTVERANCPTPSKTPFVDSSAAIAGMVFHGLGVKDGWTVYPCPCGSWHLSSKGNGRLISPYYGSRTAA